MSVRRRRSMENILRSTFSHYRYNKDTNQLSLFTNEQATPDRSFALDTISHYQIILNQKVIFSFSNDNCQYFSQGMVEQLKQQFARELRYKMVDHRIRKVYLVITITNKKKYTVCLYLRKGNQRYTTKHFDQVLEEIITWCWLTAKKSKDNTNNASSKKTANKKTNTSSADLARLAAIEEKHIQKSSDSHLINQLDKLITLKQQGHLTEEEFNLAKAKLLNELNSN